MRVPEQVCQNIPRQVCNNVPRQECRWESCHFPHLNPLINDELLRNVPRQQCQSVPRQQCNNVPRQECQNVPRQVWEPKNKKMKVAFVCLPRSAGLCPGLSPDRSAPTCQDSSVVMSPDRNAGKQRFFASFQSFIRLIIFSNVPRQECQNVPRQQCENVARQVKLYNIFVWENILNIISFFRFQSRNVARFHDSSARM